MKYSNDIIPVNDPLLRFLSHCSHKVAKKRSYRPEPYQTAYKKKTAANSLARSFLKLNLLIPLINF